MNAQYLNTKLSWVLVSFLICLHVLVVFNIHYPHWMVMPIHYKHTIYPYTNKIIAQHFKRSSFNGS